MTVIELSSTDVTVLRSAVIVGLQHLNGLIETPGSGARDYARWNAERDQLRKLQGRLVALNMGDDPND